MKFNLMNRRMFLQTGMGYVAIPFLSSLLPRTLWAQAGPMTIKRYISIMGAHDYGRAENWYPTLNRPTNVLNSSEHQMRSQPLTDFLPQTTSSLSRVFGNFLNPHIRSVSLLRSLDIGLYYGHGNGMRHLLGDFTHTTDDGSLQPGIRSFQTIDQLINSQTSFSQGRPVINAGFAFRPSSTVFAGGSYQENSVIQLAAFDRNTANLNPLYNALFVRSGVPIPQTNGADIPKPLPHPKASLLDLSMDDVQRVLGSRQISRVDRQTFQNVLDQFQTVRNNLAPTLPPVGTGACQYSSLNNSPTDGWLYSSTNSLTAMANMIVASIMCDSARTFNLPFEINYGAYDRDPRAGDEYDFHHSITHNPYTTYNSQVNWQYMGDIQRQLVQNFIRPLLQGLSATDPSNGQTYLYNSLVHYGLESALNHDFMSTPCMLAGNAGGSIKSGYYLDYANRALAPVGAENHSDQLIAPTFSNSYSGVPYNRLYNTILQAMGVPPSVYEVPDSTTNNAGFLNRNDGRFGIQNNNVARIGGYGHFTRRNLNAIPLPDQLHLARYNMNYFKDILPFPISNAA